MSTITKPTLKSLRAGKQILTGQDEIKAFFVCRGWFYDEANPLKALHIYDGDIDVQEHTDDIFEVDIEGEIIRGDLQLCEVGIMEWIKRRE